MSCRVRVLPFLLLLGMFAAQVMAGDWPGYRGPNRDGQAKEKGLFRRTAEIGLELAWKQPLGSGYSGVAIARGTLVTMHSDGTNDLMVAYDPENGSEKWRFVIGPTYVGHDGSHDGPISTPLIDSARVYGLGPAGRLFAVELKSGKLAWSSDLIAEHESQPPFYGFSTAPLLLDGVLIVEIGGKGATVAGYDPASGEMLWSAGSDGVTHQSPIPFRFDGTDQVIVSGNTKLMGLAPNSGELLWEYEHGGSGPRGIWSMTPVPAGDGRLFLAHQDEASSMIQLDATDEIIVANKLWEGRSIKNSYNVPVYLDGYLYAYSTRILTCVDAATGEPVWRSRQPGDGFMALVNGHLVIVTKQGSVHVVDATPEGYNEVARLQVFDDLAWSEPSISDGSIYLRSLSALARVDVKSSETTAEVAAQTQAIGTVIPRFLSQLAKVPQDRYESMIGQFMERQSSFPIVEGNGVVHFVYRGPGDDLAVASDVIGARQERSMHRVAGTDLFYYSMTIDPDARSNYVLVRDYEGITDPRNSRRTISRTLTREMEMSYNREATEMSWFSMPQWKEPRFLGEPAPERRGRLETHELESQALEAKHSVQVYLPAGYADTDRAYPVVYVHDGANALELGQYRRALDNLIERSIEPVIAVFIDTKPPVFGSPAPYAQMVTTELIPFVDSTYRTIPEAAGRATLGNGSLGFPSLLCTFMQPGVFGKVGSQSALLFDFALAALGPMIKTAQEQPLEIYLDWGKYDLRNPDEQWDMGQRSRDFAASLAEKGYKPAGGEVHDGTGWSSWSTRTDVILSALFPVR